jgi:hypothetical protein
MIEPHVEHGGASSWFWMAAKLDRDFAAEESKEDEGIEDDGTVPFTSSGSCSGVVTVTSSRLFTPARNCASGERNFAAIQRKM